MSISTAVETGAVARVVGVKTSFKNFRGGRLVTLPQRIAIIGQGATAATFATTKQQVSSAAEAGQKFGYGSPIHLAVAQLLPNNGDGVGSIPVTVYPLKDATSAVAAVGDITPTGTQVSAAAYRVIVNGIKSEQFTIKPNDLVEDILAAMSIAINAVLEMPVTATATTTKLTLTSKWKGASANGIRVSVDGDTTAGTTFAITQPTGGLVNPKVDTALAAIGNVWETMALNCLDIADTTALDAFHEFGEGRWGALTRKPLIVFTGTTESNVDAATAIPDARKTDRTNSQLIAPGSPNLPFVVAARQLARIAKVANDNPPRDYGSQEATGLIAGDDGAQWLYNVRDRAIKKGSSTSEVRDGVVTLSDTVTFYHPSGDPTPAYRYVCDIVKLQNIIFNVDLIFVSKAWDGAPLIPDEQPTVNPDAKKPMMAVAEAAAVVDQFGLNALISDPETAKKSIQAEIDSENPKRLNMVIPLQLSGNTNIISIDLPFGFYFGTQTVVG